MVLLLRETVRTIDLKLSEVLSLMIVPFSFRLRYKVLLYFT